ncbi:MAG: protein TolQ [Deltaproteobacteria bacterium]
MNLSDERLLDIIWGTGPMVKFILAILLLSSIFSWAIIVYKMMLLRKIEKETTAFYNLFWEKRQFPQIFAASKAFEATPLVRLFTSVYAELSQSAKQPEQGRGELRREDIEVFQRILKKTSSLEAANLEYAVGFLATTGNTAPFIGLFGTVWGIMTSFRSIGAKGGASLAVVAPGIAEALIATAMGLLAAIPAVVGYNHLLTRINRINTEMNNFSADLLNIIEKQIRK